MFNVGEYGVLLALLVSLVAGSVGLLVAALLTPATYMVARGRLQRYTNSTSTSTTSNLERPELLRERRYSSIERLDEFLRNNPLAVSAARDLARARSPLKVGEYFALMLFGGAFGCYLVITLTGSILAGFFVALLGGFAPKLYVRHQQDQRVKAAESQLLDMLTLCSNSMRSGWGFLQALENVSTELPAPISEEVRQVLEEVSLGASPEEALSALQERIPSYDLELIITAVLIQRKAGGNLAEMMDNIAHTIRERLKLFGEIRIITSEARMSTWILALLPVVILVVMTMVNNDFIQPLLVEPRGRIILMIAGGLEICGVMVLRRLANIRV